MVTNKKNDLDRFCRALTNRFALPFGGLIVVVAGDFCQLPPVGGKYVNVEPGFNNHKGTDGYNLWRTITSNIVRSIQTLTFVGQFIFQSFTHSIERSSLKALLAAEKK